jgi:hypothetical protein
LKYDRGIFIGLYNNSPISQGIKPYPEGTSVLVNNVQGTVISTLSIAIDCQVPATNDDSYYAIQLVAPMDKEESGTNTNIIRVLALDMPSIIPEPAPWDKPLAVPSWLGHKQKVMYLHNGEYHKGFLEFTEGCTWLFSCHLHNGIKKWGVASRTNHTQTPQPG